MIVNKSVIKIGSSKAITLPREIALLVKEKNKYDFKIELVSIDNLNSIIKEYKCNYCGHYFTIEYPYDIYCPSCQNEDTNSIKELDNEK